MFDLDPGKLIVIAIVALIAIPSKDLPRVLRTLGQMTGRARRMAAEFQGQFMEAMRESELDDLKKEVDEMKTAVKESVQLDAAFDPMEAARKQINNAIEREPPRRAANAVAERNEPEADEEPALIDAPHPEETQNHAANDGEGRDEKAAP